MATQKIFNQELINEENLVYKKTSLLTDKPLSYCPGCGHGTAHRLVMEVIEEMDIQAQTIGVAPVGCSVWLMNLWILICNRQLTEGLLH